MSGTHKDVMNKVLESYVKTSKGKIYHIVKHNRSVYKCYLRSGNSYTEAGLADIKQKIVNREWSAINEHEWKKWVKTDNEIIKKISNKLVKRVIMAQILLEINDDLIDDHQDNKYLKSVINKSNKECERIVKKNYDMMYDQDETLVQNLLNKIENLTKNLSELTVGQLVDVDALLRGYIKNPDKYQSEAIEMKEIKRI